MGLEATPDEYVAGMVGVFREVRRVLRDDGTLWLNIGDSYNAYNGGAGPSSKLSQNQSEQRPKLATGYGLQVKSLKPKDLMGIPWMLAFALRAPDYLGRIRNETDRAWLAALIDGEGCISIFEAKSAHGSGSSYPPIMQVRMCDRECIDKAMALVGSESDNPAQYPPSMEGQRPAYQWRIHGRKAADTIAEIYPFLLIKRKQAVVAWNHQAVRDGYETKRGVKIPAAALEKQQLCKEIMHKLNRREPVDLPSWMIEPGWYLRQDVIWSKPNPMPESVTDRCTKAHEYLFLLSKSARYYYDAEAIAEPAVKAGQVLHTYGTAAKDRQDVSDTNDRRTRIGLANWNQPCGETRNKRSVWTVSTQSFSEAHFATFPPALIEPCILAGCPSGGVVLDPFGGAGTTGLVADRLQRNAILIELNPTYAAIAEKRMFNDNRLFSEVSVA